MAIIKYDIDFVTYARTQFVKGWLTQKHWLIYNIFGNSTHKIYFQVFDLNAIQVTSINRDEIKEL